MKKRRAYKEKQTDPNLYGCFRWSASFKSVINVGGTPKNVLYGEALPERGFRLPVYKRVGISLTEVYQRGGKSDIWSVKGPTGLRDPTFYGWKKSWKRSGFVIHSYLEYIDLEQL